MEFLYSKNRFNVAVSRARTLAVLVASPEAPGGELCDAGADGAGEYVVLVRGRGKFGVRALNLLTRSWTRFEP